MNYAEILSPFSEPIAQEKAREYQFITERHLQAIWLEQKYFKKLQTHDGKPIKIISPGIWNAEAGPDFRKAHLMIGDQEYKGDIEIHLREESWYLHGHHTDARYNDVILHLSLWKSKQQNDVFTNNNRLIQQAFLEDALTISPVRIVQLVDLDLYPYRKFIGSGKCAELYKTLPNEEIAQFFKSAAFWRLSQKAIHLETKIPEPELRLGAGIAMGLGYKNNTQTFLDLFLKMFPYRHLDEQTLLAACLGTCGYFENYPQKWDKSPSFIRLKEIWTTQSEQFPFRFSLVLNQIRPLNSPVRRMVYLVKLLRDKNLERLHEEMFVLWRRSYDLKRQDFCALIPSYEDPYWNFHYSFETAPQTKFLTLLGDDLKEEIIINTFFPLLSRELKDEEKETFAYFYETFSPSGNSKAKYLIHRFFGDSAKGKLVNKAIVEQGAFQIHRDFCIHYEASCQGCPFMERYKAEKSEISKIY